MSPEAVSKLCLQKYSELPKTGKPTSDQWSVLSGIVLHNVVKKSSRVVSLGLGTKCIGASKMCKNGFIVNDSHAEVLARRGLLRYFYFELSKCNFLEHNCTDSIMEWNSEKLEYAIKPEYSFHFFCTQAPCGDACIIEDDELNLEPLAKRKRTFVEKNDIGTKLPLSTSVYTGAKIFDQSSDNDDCMVQTIGALRIKPGKGERTLSMSCSDKISKWCVIGIQGALLDSLLSTPIYLTSLSFCADTSLKALKRAIYERWKTKSNINSFELNRFKQQKPLLQICDNSIRFECAPSEKRNKPSPNGIVWCNLPEQLKPCEILVNGKRQGCTKSSYGTPQAALKISRYYLFHDFISVLEANQNLRQKVLPTTQNIENFNYLEAKNLASTYQKAWRAIKSEYFGKWTRKPDSLQEFFVN